MYGVHAEAVLVLSDGSGSVNVLHVLADGAIAPEPETKRNVGCQAVASATAFVHVMVEPDWVQPAGSVPTR